MKGRDYVLVYMNNTIAAFLCAILVALPAVADKPNKGTPPGHSNSQGVPPGLAKKGGIPPGLAKKFGVHRPAIAFIAIDPRFHDRAWFLIDNKWTLKTGFDAPLKVEIQNALRLPSVPSPIPLPRLPDPLHVISFN